jgi:hypothetical protein
MDDETSTNKSAHQVHRDEYWPRTNWRAWGSWFSWGSPIGLTLGYAITIISTGIFIWLLAVAHHIGK